MLHNHILSQYGSDALSVYSSVSAGWLYSRWLLVIDLVGSVMLPTSALEFFGFFFLNPPS